VKPALVTGASGFLGRNLVRLLLASGRPVVAVLREDSNDIGLSGAMVERHDGSTDRLVEIVKAYKPETAFHLAALVAGEKDEPPIEPLIRSNVLLGTQLAEACLQGRCHKLVAAGTYFERKSGTEAYDPVSLYAATKRAYRDILEYYARATPLRAAVVSLYDVYGPNDGRPKLLNLLAQTAASGETLKMSPGEQRLDLVHVDDAAAALLKAERALSEQTEPVLREWCAASGERVSLKRLVELFAESTGLAPKIEFGGRPYREREVMNPYLGELVPGWKPEIPLKEGLRRVYGAAARA
jgi:nucleoside-diphosphate-sugar epimerase